MRLALCGPHGSGKTALADVLAGQIDWRQRSFADALRDEVATALATKDQPRGEILRQMRTPGAKELWRPVLQFWGTEIRRNLFDTNYWVAQFDKYIDRFPSPNWVVDDCRFPNEQRLLLGRGFTFVRLALPPGVEPRPDDHESEQHWPLWPFAVDLPWVEGAAARRDTLMEMLK